MRTEESVVAKLHEARQVLLKGDAAGALIAIDKLDGSGYATYHLVRAECLYALHNYSEAKRECERTLALSPNTPRATILLELIDEMLTLDKWVQPEQKGIDLTSAESAQALPKLQRQPPPAPMASEEPSDDENTGLASETLATILIKQGKFAEARKIYIQLSRLHPERDGYYHERIVEMERAMIV